MANFSVLISFLSILGLMTGLVYPRLGLFWYAGKKSRINAVVIYGTSLVLSFLVFAASTSIAPVAAVE
ncbi:MAG: hypothetical protein LPK09_11085 [Hymenobacteraceae bacterium]|nr:hypothetical protein [Hymenobacteraceae bacterium]